MGKYHSYPIKTNKYEKISLYNINLGNRNCCTGTES